MAKNKSTNRAITIIWGIVAWFIGILIALAVGFGMRDGILRVPGLEGATVAAGWVIIVLTIVGAILALIDKLTE